MAEGAVGFGCRGWPWWPWDTVPISPSTATAARMRGIPINVRRRNRIHGGAAGRSGLGRSRERRSRLGRRAPTAIRSRPCAMRPVRAIRGKDGPSSRPGNGPNPATPCLASARNARGCEAFSAHIQTAVAYQRVPRMRNHITPDHCALPGPSIEAGPGSSAALRTQRLERLHDERSGDVTGPPPRPPGAGVSPTSDFEGFGSFS
jgi:hypothetical protein